VFVCFFCFSFFLSCSFVLGAFLRPRAESQFLVRHSLALLRASPYKCRHSHLWVVTSNAFLGFPTAWEQPSPTKRGLLESLSRSGTFAWTGNCPFNWELANFHNAIRSAQLDRFFFLARCNLNKLPTSRNGNIKWGAVKMVIANIHFSVFNVKSFNRLRRLRQKHLNSTTSQQFNFVYFWWCEFDPSLFLFITIGSAECKVPVWTSSVQPGRFPLDPAIIPP